MSARSRSAPWWGPRRVPKTHRRPFKPVLEWVPTDPPSWVVGFDHVTGLPYFTGSVMLRAPRFNRVIYGFTGPRAPWWRRLWWRFVAWLGW